MRGVVVFTQVFLHTYVGHPFTIAFSAPHLHAAGLIMLGGQEGRAPSRINVDVVMREIGSVRLCEKNRLTAALVIALAIVQTIRTLAYCSRVGKDVHKRKVLGGPAYNNVGAPKRAKTRTTNLYCIWAVGNQFYKSTPLCSDTILSVTAWP